MQNVQMSKRWKNDPSVIFPSLAHSFGWSPLMFSQLTKTFYFLSHLSKSVNDWNTGITHWYGFDLWAEFSLEHPFFDFPIFLLVICGDLSWPQHCMVWVCLYGRCAMTWGNTYSRLSLASTIRSHFLNSPIPSNHTTVRFLLADGPTWYRWGFIEGGGVNNKPIPGLDNTLIHSSPSREWRRLSASF